MSTLKLSPKEQTVLLLMCDDMTAKEVAVFCDNSVDTIRTHIKNAKFKLGCNTDHGACSKLIRNGIIINR